MDAGASRCGFASAEPVARDAVEAYARWVSEGKHHTMDYCAKYADVRSDPRLLLDGCHTVISTAWAYPRVDDTLIASYALVHDYHHVVRQKLEEIAADVTERWGGATRAVVDTAPMRERYWAVEAGVGYIGVNNMLIVPGVGSYVFLGELLWTGTVPADSPCAQSCAGCKACVRACPAQALSGNGTVDARKCLSCLTIECGDPLPEGLELCMMYGCDMCQRVCPHNRDAWDQPTVFTHDDAIDEITPDSVMTMTSSHYRKLVSHSAMRRVRLTQLQRNAQALSPSIKAK